jgi:hypothetical protein
MSSADLFNQARGKREEAMVLLRQADELHTAATKLGGTFGSTTQSFGSETWRGPNATQVFHLLNDCHCNLRYCTGLIFDDVATVRLKAHQAEDAASILESDGRMMARVEAEAEAARQRAAVEAAAAQARAAQASAQAAAQAAAAVSAKPSSPPTATAPAATPVLTFAPIATTTTTTLSTGSSSGSSSSSSSSTSTSPGHDDSDYSGWY